MVPDMYVVADFSDEEQPASFKSFGLHFKFCGLLDSFYKFVD